MKPLATTRQVLTWLCIFQPDNSVGNMKKLLYTVFSLGLFGFLVCQVISSACFFLRFVTVDMETSLYAIYPICSWTSASYVFVVAYISRHKISSLFTELTAIFDTSTSQFFRCFHFELLIKLTFLQAMIRIRLNFWYKVTIRVNWFGKTISNMQLDVVVVSAQFSAVYFRSCSATIHLEVCTVRSYSYHSNWCKNHPIVFFEYYSLVSIDFFYQDYHGIKIL